MSQLEATSPAARHAPIRKDAVSQALRGAPHRMLDVGHSKIAHWSFGAGPDVVCVHGWPLHAATFRNLVPRLSEHFRVHLLDMPGAGKSEWSERSKITISAHAASVRRATELLGLERFAYLAHDSGGAISRFAARGDRRVFANVLGNTELPRHVPWQIVLYMMAAKFEPVWQLFVRGMSVGALRRSPIAFGACFADPTYVDGEFGEWFVEPLLADARIRRGQSALVHGLETDAMDGLSDAHRELVGRTLLVWGANDPFFPIDKARAMIGEFERGATLVAIPDAKLFAHEDRAGAFLDAAIPFLAEEHRRS